MSLTAALAAHLLGLGRRLKIGLWIWLGLTMLATVYFGWHYFLDDLARPGHRRSARSASPARSPASTCAPLRVTPRSAQPAAD